MDKQDNYDNVRIAIASSLIAASVGLLAVMNSAEKVLGLFMVGPGFVIAVYNFIVLLLLSEVVIGIVFLLSTGFKYGFNDEKHSMARWMQKRSYSVLLAVFPVSFLSIVYNAAIELFGLDSLVGIIFAVGIVLLAILIGVFLLKNNWRNKVKRQ